MREPCSGLSSRNLIYCGSSPIAPRGRDACRLMWSLPSSQNKFSQPTVYVSIDNDACSLGWVDPRYLQGNLLALALRGVRLIKQAACVVLYKLLFSALGGSSSFSQLVTVFNLVLYVFWSFFLFKACRFVATGRACRGQVHIIIYCMLYVPTQCLQQPVVVG